MLEFLFNKVAGFRPTIAISFKKTPVQMFFCEYDESFKKNFLQNTFGRLLTAFSKSTLGNTETLEIS